MAGWSSVPDERKELEVWWQVGAAATGLEHSFQQRSRSLENTVCLPATRKLRPPSACPAPCLLGQTTQPAASAAHTACLMWRGEHGATVPVMGCKHWAQGARQKQKQNKKQSNKQNKQKRERKLSKTKLLKKCMLIL